MAPPLAACLVLVGIHAYLGIHVLAREVIFVDLSLAQIAALGGTIAIILGYELHSTPAYLLSLAAAIVGAVVFTFTRSYEGRVSQEAVIGIVYAVSAAAGILVLDRAPHGADHIKHILVGSILWVTWADVWGVLAIYVPVALLHILYRDRFLLISFDPPAARRRGLRIKRWDFFFYGSFAFVITSSVHIAGVLLVFAFLIVPAVCSILLVQSLKQRVITGWAIGFVVSAAGCALSYAADLPTGATIVCTFGLALVWALTLSLAHRT